MFPSRDLGRELVPAEAVRRMAQFKATLQCGCIQIPYILRIKIAWTDKRPKLVVGEKLDNDSVIPSDWLACV